MSLTKGTVIYGTQLGQYNFHYPDTSVSLLLPYDIQTTKPSWHPVTLGTSITFRAHKLHEQDAINLNSSSKIVWVMDL